MLSLLIYPLCLLGAFSSLSVNSTPVTVPRGTSLNLSPVSNADLVCVTPPKNPDWGAGGSSPPISNDCYAAMWLISNRIKENLFASYEFYAESYFPYPRTSNSWPLPQGASSGRCSVVIRMTRDFNEDVLPLPADTGGGFLPTWNRAITQYDQWANLVIGMHDLFSGCVQQHGLPGWRMETANIIIAFWPRNSIMNEQYGIHASSALAVSNSSNVSTSFVLVGES